MLITFTTHDTDTYPQSSVNKVATQVLPLMIQHRSPPIASPVFCCNKHFQSSKARTKPCLPLQAASSEAMAVIESGIIVHHPSHAVQSIFCNHFISQSSSMYIRWAKNSEGGILAMKPLAKAFC